MQAFSAGYKSAVCMLLISAALLRSVVGVSDQPNVARRLIRSVAPHNSLGVDSLIDVHEAEVTTPDKFVLQSAGSKADEEELVSEQRRLEAAEQAHLALELRLERESNDKYRYYASKEEEKQALVDSGKLQVQVIGERPERGTLMVSCKGEVFRGWPQQWEGVIHEGYDGCGYNDGSCADKRYQTGNASHYMEDDAAGPVETLVVLTQPQWSAYYHFVIDSLSRFTHVKEQYPALVADKQTFYHTGDVGKVGQAWAELLGLEPHQFLAGSVKAKKVLFPPSNSCANLWRGPVPRAVRGMRDIVAKHLPAAGMPSSVSPDQPTMLVIRRQNHGPRSLDNQDHLLDSLRRELPSWNVEEFGTQNYSDPFSKFVVPDTKTGCAMFHRANIVVGPHGAGFANLICARAGTAVIELQQTPHTPDFQLLSEKLNLPYYGVPVWMEHYGTGVVNVQAVLEMVQGARRELVFSGMLDPAAV